jgi:hypothetical protein
MEKVQKDHNLTNDITVIATGDFNARPKDSVVHLMMNKPFSMNIQSGRLNPEEGYMTYSNDNPESENNIELLNLVETNKLNNKSSIAKI